MYVAWGVTAVLVIGLEIVAIKRYMNRKKAVATVESAAEPVPPARPMPSGCLISNN